MGKKRATDYERDLGDRFWELGFAVMRAPSSSGTTKYPRPDLLVGSAKRNKIIAIELKTARKDLFYISKKQVDGLIQFSELFGAEPYIAVKYVGKRMQYRFLHALYDLEQSRGESYRMTSSFVKEKGKLIDDLIKD